MKVIFNQIPETKVSNLRGGQGDILMHVGGDDKCKVQKMIVKKGNSIGYHAHEGSLEVIYILSGTATVVDDGQSYELHAGQAGYCPEHHEHSVANNQGEDLVFLAVIPTL